MKPKKKHQPFWQQAEANPRNPANPTEFYPSPQWSVRRLCGSGLIPMGGRFLEPCAGDGAIIRAINLYCEEKRRPPPHWQAIELREDLCAHLRQRLPGIPLLQGDALRAPWPTDIDALVTNPPFSLGEALWRRAREKVGYLALLMRIGWLEPKCRARLFHDDMPDIGILSPRPSFVGGKMDNAVYSWLVWRRGVYQRQGRVMMLDREESNLQMEMF